MKSRKYKEQYRLVDRGPGKAREAQYVGQYFALPSASVPRFPLLFPAVFTALFWAFALLFLRFSPVLGRCMYAAVPLIVSLLPGFYALLGLFSAFRAPARMTVVQRENGLGRATRSTLGCGIFAAIGAVGGVVFLSLERQWAAGWREPLLAALASAAAWLAFARFRRLYNALEVVD